MRKIFVVTDYACNNKCVSCAKKPDEKGILSLEDIMQKLAHIKPVEDDFIEISGGEPTIRKDIIEICDLITSSYKSKLILLSHGRTFKDPAFAERIKDAGVSRVMTTFYSPYEQGHEAVTGVMGSYQESIDGLHNLERLGMPISVKTIILKQNYRDLPAFVNFAYDTFPTAWVSLHGLIIRGRAEEHKDEVTPRYSEIKPYVEQALDIAIEREKNLGVFILPTCTIDPYYWQYLSVNWRDMTKTMIYISPEITVEGNLDVEQPAYCEGCLMSDNCSWAWESAWKEYTALFGIGELRKVV
ncbi:MAG: radical SAM protein [Nanoarchaeota archaeon]